MKISEFVKKYDPENQFDVLKNSFQQLEYAWNNKIDLSTIKTERIKNVVVTGLGGSAIGGDFFIEYARDEFHLPYYVNRNYKLPEFVNEDTLVICSSYSGNTEETLSAFEDALQRKAQIICITKGGKIESSAKSNGIPTAHLLDGFQPRYAFWINIFTLIKIFQSLNLISDQSSIVNSIINQIKERSDHYTLSDNYCIKFAESLIGFIPIVYSVANYTSSVGGRLKCQFNENSKIHSFHNVFPEMNHNEIIGWETAGHSECRYRTIQINDEIYPEQIKKRIRITSEIIAKTGTEVLYLQSDASDFKIRLFDLIYTGDWISYYLSVLRGQSPTAITNINFLKNQLAG